MSQQEEHSFGIVEAPDVNSSSVLLIVIESFFWFEHSDHMTISRGIVDLMNKPVSFGFIMLPLSGPGEHNSVWVEPAKS